MKYSFLVSLVIILGLTACIKDDIIFDRVDPTFRITSTIDTLAVDDSFQFETRFTNNVGGLEDVDVTWSSSDPSVITIDEEGLALAISGGTTTILAVFEYEGAELSSERIVSVGEETVIVIPVEKTGSIMPSSFYELEGDFTITEDGEDLIIQFADNYVADSSLPGLYLYLTNNPNTISGALEIRRVDIFQGAHQYRVSGNVGIDTYSYLLYFCKPFTVKVGDGEIN